MKFSNNRPKKSLNLDLIELDDDELPAKVVYQLTEEVDGGGSPSRKRIPSEKISNVLSISFFLSFLGIFAADEERDWKIMFLDLLFVAAVFAHKNRKKEERPTEGKEKKLSSLNNAQDELDLYSSFLTLL